MRSKRFGVLKVLPKKLMKECQEMLAEKAPHIDQSMEKLDMRVDDYEITDWQKNRIQIYQLCV